MIYVTSDDFSEKDCFNLLFEISNSNKFDFTSAQCWTRPKYSIDQRNNIPDHFMVEDKRNYNNYIIVCKQGDIVYSPHGDKNIIKDYIDDLRRQKLCNSYFN